METFDLTPDPKVLIALTHTPMQPLDALCELIDNALDAFSTAELRGSPIRTPMVIIDMPKPSQIRGWEGYLIVRDNGLGLDAETAEKALRAGFSGNNPYDSLGLFGMGFNISTGKLGRVTRFTTSRKHDEKAIEVKIDLDEMNVAKSYKVPVKYVDKPGNFEQGTLIEVSKWWPDGNPNSGFIRKLVQYGMPKVREEIGRRYASILKNKKTQIIINGEPVTHFEHCTWDDSRYVERRDFGKISAVYRFDEVVGTQRRCTMCTALVQPGETACPACNSASTRTIEERIRGWVGIQRYDDETDFGIDLIRNGRAIRIGEKAAFFEFTDEFKRTIKDYPIDSIYGRIVGEVHLNHVPVDFLKQDFQRSTPEWQNAISYLRGNSSLQPKQPGADQNTSFLFKLYQGYRRVRKFGKGDMYMGYWDKSSGEPKRISRETEREYLDKFRKKIPGFYDDSEWWKLVEQADKKPLEEMVECPSCQAQNLKGYDTCQVCGHVLIGKTCLNPECLKTIATSADICPHCGGSQIVEIKKPWKCNVCGFSSNDPEATTCRDCGMLKGALHPLSRDYLFANSNKTDDLSINGCTVVLADGSYSQAIDVNTYLTQRPIRPPLKAEGIPLIAIKTPDGIEIFLDSSHRLFRSLGIYPEQMISSEVALYIYDSNRRLSSYFGLHSLSNIAWHITQDRWGSILEDTADKLRSDIFKFFDDIRQQLPGIMHTRAEDFFNDLSDETQKKLVDNMLNQGQDITRIPEMKLNGDILRYLDEKSIVDVFKQYTNLFFDGKYWNEPYAEIPGLSDEIIEQVKQRNRSIYVNCLEDITSYLIYRNPEKNIINRARASLNFLMQKIV